MNIKTISNEELAGRLTKLVQTERKITHLILECINEIEIRKIHLKAGYASLFDYLTRKVSTLEKREVLSQIISKNTQQTEVILAQQFQVEVPKVATQIKNHQDESQSVTIYLTKAEAEILEQAKRLLSNKTKTHSLKDALIYLANKEIEKSKNKMIHAETTCNYQDPKTGTKCTANHFLEQDHIQPRWAGGSDDKSNLQILCSNHNKLRYQQQSFLI